MDTDRGLRGWGKPVYDHIRSTGGRGNRGGGDDLAKRSLPGPSPERRHHPATDFPRETSRQVWQSVPCLANFVPPRIPAELVLNFHALEVQQDVGCKVVRCVPSDRRWREPPSLTNWQIMNLTGLILLLACPFLLICRLEPRGRLASPDLLIRHVA